MTTRNSSIKLSLNSGSFSSQMRSLTGRVGIMGRGMGMALSRPLSAGFAAAKQQLAGITSSMKNTIKTYGTLAGTIATGLLTKNAVELQGLYRNLAFDISKTSDSMMDWKDVQKDVDDAALATGQRAKEIASAYSDVYRATGNVDYSRKVLEAIGTAATASGEEVTNYATAAQMMMRKFNLTAEQIPDAIAAITQQVNSGALGLDGLNNRFGMLAGEAKMAGMVGVDGMTDLLGLFRLLDSEMGEKLTPALTTMLQYMKAGTTYAKEFKKAGVNIEPDMSFMNKFKQMLQGKGRIVAEEKFTGFSRNAFDLLAKPFDDALKEAQAKGMKKAEAVDYAMKRLDKAFAAASDTTWSYSDLQRKAADRMRDDPSVKLRVALGKLESALSKPKMIGAIEKLADKLPMLAEKLAELIDWIADNPWKAAGLAVGAKVGIPAISAAVGAGVAAALKGIGGAVLGGGAAAAAGAGTAAAGAGAATAAGTTAVAGTTAAGTAAAVGGVAATAAIGAAGAVGAGVGYVGYKASIEPELKKMSETTRSIGNVLTDVDMILASKRDSLRKSEDIKNAITRVKVLRKKAEEGPGFVEKTLNMFAGAFGNEKLATEQDYKWRNERKQLMEAELQLVKALKQLNEGAGKAANGLNKLGQAAPSVPGSETSKSSRGVRKPANSVPGAVGVEG